MKTERRHELQQNTLVEMLNEAGENAKPYAKGIAGVLVAILVIFGVYMYLSRQSEREVAAGWDQTFQAISDSRDSTERRKDLKAAADAYPNKPSGIWAQLMLADSELQDGTQLLFQDQGSARNMLGVALEDYKAVFERARDQIVRQRALFGTGRCQESLDKLDDARSTYEQLVKEFPGGAYEQRAKERLEQLSQTSTKEWYDWFHKAEPTNTAFGNESTSTGPDKSIFEGPSLKMPKNLPETPEEKYPAPKEKGGEKPAADKATTDKPSTDKPGTEKPAADKGAEKPATEKTSTDKTSTDKPAADKSSTDKAPADDAKPAPASSSTAPAKPADSKPADSADDKKADNKKPDDKKPDATK